MFKLRIKLSTDSLIDEKPKSPEPVFFLKLRVEKNLVFLFFINVKLRRKKIKKFRSEMLQFRRERLNFQEKEGELDFFQTMHFKK